MHELSLLENVREMLVKNALSQSFSKVAKVTLEIGRFSNVEPDALRFCFDVVMKDSLAENAELIIAEVDGLGVCPQYRRQLAMTTLYDACVNCGSPFVKVIQGFEMKIKDLTVI